MCQGWTGLAALVARGERTCCTGVVGGLARVGADCEHRPPLPLLPLPAPPPPPSGPAPVSSAASGRWGVVPGLETGGGGERGGACGGGLYVGSPPQLDWWVGLYHGELGAVCCHADIYWYESFPPRVRWSLISCRARFFEAAAAGVCVALILRTIRSTVSLGWFWAMARSYSMTRSATTSRSSSSWEDLDARRSY